VPRRLVGQMSATARPTRGTIAARALKPLARQSDDRLVELSRAGDERAFEALVRRHGHELRVYAGRLLGAEGRAEDALQHALMSAWVALRDRDATVANPRAWLYGIVHNSAVTVLRRARHDTVELNEALGYEHAHAGPEVGVVVGEILAGLAEMPEIQRRAMVMTAVAGSSHEEAAAALGVSDGAVRGMVYRARAALRQAAAALLPAPLWGWAARFAHRRARLPVDPTDAATAITSASAASAGVGALIVKGGAIVAAVGALAGTGGALLPGAGGRPQHHRPAAHHRAASPRPQAAALQSPVAGSRGPIALPSEARHDLDPATHGESAQSGGRGRGGSSSSHGRGGGSGGSDGTSGSSGSGHSSGSGSTSGRGGGESGSSGGGDSGSSGSGDSGSSGGGDSGSSGSGNSGSSGSGDSGSSGSGNSGSGSGDSGSSGGNPGSGSGNPGSGSGGGGSGSGGGGSGGGG
jgi:RNA polymerase sigma factor (sigma-70 family)